MVSFLLKYICKYIYFKNLGRIFPKVEAIFEVSDWETFILKFHLYNIELFTMSIYGCYFYN